MIFDDLTGRGIVGWYIMIGIQFNDILDSSYKTCKWSKDGQANFLPNVILII